MSNDVVKSRVVMIILSLIVISALGLSGFTCNKKQKSSIVKFPKWNSSLIIYASDETGDFEIYAIEADGKNKVNLTKNSGLDFYPAWSSKRDKIAFSSDRDGSNDIFVMNRDGSNLKKLARHDKANEFAPAFTPDGRFITFSSDRDGPTSSYIMKSDGTNIKRLTTTHEYAAPIIFSPDGKTMILKRRFDNPQKFEFFLADINGKNVRDMDPTLNYGHEDPLFSHDGKTIIYSAYDPRSKTWQIFSVDTATGMKLKRMTSDPKGTFSQPFYSPDEKKIVYTRMERYGTDWSLWLMNADGSAKKRITRPDVKANTGVFSPDGKSILAMVVTSGKKNDSNWRVATISTDTFKIKPLTTHNNNDMWPRWFEPKNIP